MLVPVRFKIYRAGVKDWLLEFDPGLCRLRSAVRGTLAVVCIYFASSFLVRQMGWASSLPYMGVLVSILASLFVLEPSWRQQKRTLWLMVPPVVLSVVCGILFSPYAPIRLGGFLLYVFVIILVRPRGPRWTAVGVTSFMSYFCALFFNLQIHDMPAAMTVALLAVVLTFATRFWLFPDDIARVLKWTYRSFELRRARPHPARLSRMTFAALHFETTFHENEELAPRESAELLEQLLEAELAARREVDAPASARDQLDKAFARFRADVERLCPNGPGKPPRFAVAPALQATLATGLATLVGLQVSAQRWYWASFAAFFTLMGASRGETLARALLRVLGTVGGLLLGLVLAHFVHARGLEGAFLFIGVFFTIYSARVHYGLWTAMLFTLLLALFYDYLGMMTGDILSLRLYETLIGAAIGAAVAFFVFPVRTRKIVLQARGRLLSSVEELISRLHAVDRRELIRSLRTIDQDLADLRAAAGPFEGRSALGRDSEVPGILHEAAALVHLLKQVAAEGLSARR